MKKRIRRTAKLFAKLGAKRPWHCARALEVLGDYPYKEPNIKVIIVPMGEDCWEEWWELPRGAVRTYLHDRICLAIRGWEGKDKPTIVPLPEKWP